MPSELINFIAKYGYVSIFLLVFIQEIGIPTFPNEVALIYFGYLSYKGILNFFNVAALAIAADIIGSCLVFFLFYFFSSFIKSRKPKWLSLRSNVVSSLRMKIVNGGIKSIFIGRLTPYLRGYTSLICGAVKINSKKYLTTVISTAIIWSGGYVALGYFIAPYWNNIAPRLGIFSNALIVIPIVLMAWYAIKFISAKNPKILL